VYIRKVTKINVSEAVTLPKMMCKALGINRGDLLWVSCKDNQIILKKIVDGEREIRDLVLRRDRRT